jgi:hypothetical protein
MMMAIDLVWLADGGQNAPTWGAGEVHSAAANVRSVAQAAERASTSAADGVLFWDARLGTPDERHIAHILTLPGNIWHAGLKLGMGGLPAALNHVQPLWMLNADPAPDITATSWRLSLHACLIQMAALRHLGGLSAHYTTLTGAALDMGYRAVVSGLLPRHTPALLAGAGDVSFSPEALPIADELLFIWRNFFRWQFMWATARRILTGGAAPGAVIGAAHAALRTPRPPRAAFPHPEPAALPLDPPRITVLIPTIDRYPYLRVLLDQMRRQTLPPHEIIVIDQTPAAARDTELGAHFADLPLTVIHQDVAGQCWARNAGLKHSTGDYIMFLDDDDEIPSDLLERHYRTLHTFRADVSSGIVYEPPMQLEHVRREWAGLSDVFPTNVTLMRRTSLYASGLFDNFFNQRARADHDLGMRVYLSGGLMIMDHRAPILHHHAPRGGLRSHGARVITRADSRRSLIKRRIFNTSDAYIGLRYYTPHHVREASWLSVISGFGIQGGLGTRLLRAAYTLLVLPDTLSQISRAQDEARALMTQYPEIPTLEPPPLHTPPAGSAAGSAADSSAARAGD